MTSLQAQRWIITPTAVLLALLPAGLLAWNAANGRLSANPIKEITEETGVWTLRFLMITLAIRPLRTEEYPAPARRPPFSVLDKSASYRLLGLTPIHWREHLRAMLREVAAALPAPVVAIGGIGLDTIGEVAGAGAAAAAVIGALFDAPDPRARAAALAAAFAAGSRR